jgi:hypothetical protein
VAKLTKTHNSPQPAHSQPITNRDSQQILPAKGQQEAANGIRKSNASEKVRDGMTKSKENLVRQPIRNAVKTLPCGQNMPINMRSNLDLAVKRGQNQETTDKTSEQSLPDGQNSGQKQQKQTPQREISI